MEGIEVDSIATPTLTEPALIEGLPGVGLVGKLAVDHLRGELDARPVRRIYSEHLPPAVAIDGEGTASMASMTLYAAEAGGRDLLVLAGDSQASEGAGQYRLAGAVLDAAAEFGVEEVVGLGGFGTGEGVEEYRVVGAAAEGSDDLRARLADAGVAFGAEDAPDNIVGMSGLLVGLGARRGLEAAGLLGITPGYYVDPASARAVLEVLQAGFGFSVDLDTLEEQARQVQQLLEQLQEGGESAGGEDLRYFG